jgi:8-oxo-dGTP diphosphatase
MPPSSLQRQKFAQLPAHPTTQLPGRPDDRNPIPDRRPRGGRDPAVKQVVAALISRDGKILVCQRTRHQPMPLKWEFPGGKVEANERQEEALFRELEEELGIQARIGEKVTTIRHSYANGTVVELHFYTVEEYAGEIQNRIFRDVRWADPCELPDYDFLEADVSLIRRLARGELGAATKTQDRTAEARRHGEE